MTVCIAALGELGYCARYSPHFQHLSSIAKDGMTVLYLSLSRIGGGRFSMMSIYSDSVTFDSIYKSHRNVEVKTLIYLLVLCAKEKQRLWCNAV